MKMLKNSLKNTLKHLNFRTIRNIVIAVIIFILAFRIGSIYNKPTNQTISDVTELGLKDIGELYTQVGYYTTIINSPLTADAFGIELPFTDSKYIFTCDGTIKAGYNFEDIEVKYIDKDNKIIVLLMPEPIIDNKIDHDSFVIIDEQKNIFTPLTPERMNDAFIQAENDAKDKAVANGLLENAEANAKVLISSFINGFYGEEYQIRYENK